MSSCAEVEVETVIVEVEVNYQSSGIITPTFLNDYDDPMIVDADGIEFDNPAPEIYIFIQSLGGQVEVTADPEISLGKFRGQKITLIGTSADDVVLLNPSANLLLRAPLLSDLYTKLVLLCIVPNLIYLELDRS